MRELKFRAWNTVRNCWTSRVELDGGWGKPMFMHGEIENDSGYQTDNTIIEQYTGLKDKNGKEIYEGDVVNIQGVKYYVDFEHGGFWFNNDNRKWKANRPFTHFQEINDTMVIGNIHENPELLEEKE